MRKFILIGFIFSFLFGDFAFSQQKTSDYKLRTVVIDAGHGGKDPGCHGIHFKEKDVALGISLKLGKLIEENCKDVKVIYTRSTDVFVPLNERAEIANKNKADLFICIHCNASTNKEAFGSATYVMGLYKTKGNLDVAKRENSSILMESNYKKTYDGFDPNSDEGNIIFSMYQNEYLQQSLDLAAKIQDQYKNQANREDKGVKQAGFLVLWRTAMPSLLTETGFLTNPNEEKFLGSQKGQTYLASSIFRAFREYKDEMEGKQMNTDDKNFKKPVLKKEDLEQDSINEMQLQKNNFPKDTILIAKQDSIPRDTVSIQKIKKISPTKKKTSTEKLKTSIQKLKIDSVPLSAPTKDPIVMPPQDSNVFRVQFASFSKKIPLDDKKFDGLKDVWEYQAGEIYKYTAGNFATADKAIALQTKMRKNGFKDAFVVIFKNGKRISTNDAAKLLKK
ncbi:MAG: N-acetylmuramoyl-L-alanine amidase [Bacteroidia bacterium]